MSDHLVWRGRAVLTIDMAAARHGRSRAAIKEAIRRYQLAPIEPPPIDRRTPMYDAEALDAMIAAMPGRGANLRGHG